MFDLDQFKSECIAAAQKRSALQEMHEIITRTVEDPNAVLKALGEPARSEIQTLYRSDDLTILNVIWGPYMMIRPHTHEMWAVIGIYTGREDNILWRRISGDPHGRVEAAAARALSVRETFPLGDQIIHSVTNPIGKLTGAIHVYGGDFFTVPRKEWEPETLTEQPFDVDRTLLMFEESNRLYQIQKG